MDDRKLLELARKAGGIDLTNQIAGGITVWIGTGTPEFLERFAHLVAAAEREKCAEVCDKEAAFYGECGWVQAASNCAAAIRAFGNSDEN